MKTLIFLFFGFLVISLSSFAKTMTVCSSVKNTISWGENPAYKFSNLINTTLGLDGDSRACVFIVSDGVLVKLPSAFVDSSLPGNMLINFAGVVQYDASVDIDLAKKQKKAALYLGRAARRYGNGFVDTKDGIQIDPGQEAWARSTLENLK